MKSKIAMVTLVIVAVFLSACARSTTDQGAISDTVQIKADDLEESVDVPEEKKTRLVEVNLGDTISDDYTEITFTRTATTKQVYEEESGIYLEEEEGFIYFLVFGKIKNIHTSQINLINSTDVKLVFDDKYEYSVIMQPNDLSTIVPLKTISFAMYALVPVEVINSCETFAFNIGYNDGFLANANLDHCDNTYVITGRVDQYGSADNIENFQTFTEYVELYIQKYPDLTDWTGKDIVYIKKNNMSQYLDLEDGSEFCITPILGLNYGIYELQTSFNDTNNQDIPYGILKIAYESRDVKNQGNGKSVYYIYGNRLTISSDAGEITVGEQVFERNLGDKSGGRLLTEFNIFPKNCSYDELWDVLNGNDVKIIVNTSVSDLERSDLTIDVEFECRENIVEALKLLMVIYSEMPRSSFNLD